MLYTTAPIIDLTGAAADPVRARTAIQLLDEAFRWVGGFYAQGLAYQQLWADRLLGSARRLGILHQERWALRQDNFCIDTPAERAGGRQDVYAVKVELGTSDGRWVPASQPPGAVLVLVSEALAARSGGRWHTPKLRDRPVSRRVVTSPFYLDLTSEEAGASAQGERARPAFRSQMVLSCWGQPA